MKYVNKLVSTVAAFSMLFMIACGGGDDNPAPNPGTGGGGGDGGGGDGGGGTEMPGTAIVGTWEQLEAADVVGPAAENFTNFSITIAATSEADKLDYTADNTEPLVFPAEGQFTEIAADANFSEGVQVMNGSTPTDITLVSETELRMVFTVDANSGIPSDNSRTAEVGGEYTFNLTKAAE